MLSTAHRLQGSEKTLDVFVRRGKPIKFRNNGLEGNVTLKPYELRYLDGDQITTRLNTPVLTETFFYRMTHANHPCAIWTRESTANYEWHWRLLVALCDEYSYRYGAEKVHKVKRTGLVDALQSPPKNLPTGNLTPFAQAMPDEYKNSDAVEAYRAYYRNAKKDLLTYRNRPSPSWIG